VQYKNYENIPNSGEAAMMVQFVNQPKKTYDIGIYIGVETGMQIYRERKNILRIQTKY
jgi:hypothetical protein